MSEPSESSAKARCTYSAISPSMRATSDRGGRSGETAATAISLFLFAQLPARHDQIEDMLDVHAVSVKPVFKFPCGDRSRDTVFPSQAVQKFG